jgi:hypothetical protein
MPPTHLRYTGCFPPAEVLQRFPNWEYALDEEHLDGQDETTLRPASDQKAIADQVCFTAGLLTLPSGRRLKAMLEVDHGSIQGLTALEDGRWSWCLRLLGKPAGWQSIPFDWSPDHERPRAVSQADSEVFPLIAESLLSVGEGANARVTIPRRA